MTSADDIFLMAAALHVGGVSPSERLVLIAYADHADKRGYCWPSVDRLAEITGLSRATVTRANKRLRTLGLIVSIRRVNPRTGEPIFNLTRLNIARMRAMRRRPAEPYADLIQEITLPEDGTDDTAGGDTDDAPETGSDQLIHHGEPYLRLTVSHTPSHHEPLTSQRTSQKNSSSPLTDARQSQPSHEEEEEAATPKSETQERDDGEHQAAAAGLVAELPALARLGGRPLGRDLLPGEVDRLTKAITGHLAAGWPVERLRAVLGSDLGSAWGVVGAWHHRLGDLGAPPAATAAAASSAREPCGQCNSGWLEDHAGNLTGPCPACRPSMIGAAR